MKRLIVAILLPVFVIGALASCSKDTKETEAEETEATTTTVETTTVPEEPAIEIEPDEIQIRSICQLATLECYYNDVAKGYKSKGIGLSHIGEKDRTFWVEYSAVATLGVDISEVSMAIEGNTIFVYLPEATLLGNVKVIPESYNTGSIVQDIDNKVNTNDITADDITWAVNSSLAGLETKVSNDKTLLNNSRERAKTLIRAYVQKLAETSGQDYKVVFRDASERYQ